MHSWQGKWAYVKGALYFGGNSGIVWLSEVLGQRGGPEISAVLKVYLLVAQVGLVFDKVLPATVCFRAPVICIWIGGRNVSYNQGAN